MFIYAVDLTIDQSVFAQFKTWLKPHIEEILALPGFMRAHCLQLQDNDSADTQQLTIQYEIETMAALDDYLQHHAERMRDQGLQAFPGQFSASRRIYSHENTFVPVN